MIAVLGVSHKDAYLAIQWLEWVNEIGVDGTLVVMLTKRASAYHGMQFLQAKKSNPNIVIEVAPDQYERGYPVSAAHLFVRSLEYCNQAFPEEPVLWIEPDAVPVKSGWMTAIAEEHQGCGQPFMGCLEPECNPPHMAGVAVYPPNWKELSPLLAECMKAPDVRHWGSHRGQPFDTYCAPQVYPQAAQAKTIQQIWKCEPITEMTISRIFPGTFLFHQCKTGSLIRTLRARHYKDSKPIPLG